MNWALNCCAILLLVSSCFALFPFDGEDWESGDIYLENSGKGDTLFYYLMRSRNKTADKKLIIWLNGGPGSSSAIGLFYEIGPYMLNMSGGYNINPYSWNNEYDVLYVDQPPGTGNSLVENTDHLCRDERCVGRNFYSFLTRFYELHPEYKTKPLYITGESYGGHYIPAIGAYLLKANNPEIILKGIAIGNGYIEQVMQSQFDAIYLYANGVLNFVQTMMAKSLIVVCGIAVKMRVEHIVNICVDIEWIILSVFQIKQNPYDIRTNESTENRSQAFLKIMNNETIKKAFKAENRIFNANQSVVNKAMHQDLLETAADNIRYISDTGTSVLLYFGDKDYVCHWMGGEELANSIKWKNAEKFRQIQYKDWLVGKNVVGKYKKVDNYMFLIVKDAGHMVPANLPYIALEMLKQFINGNFE